MTHTTIVTRSYTTVHAQWKLSWLHSVSCRVIIKIWALSLKKKHHRFNSCQVKLTKLASYITKSCTCVDK